MSKGDSSTASQTRDIRVPAIKKILPVVGLVIVLVTFIVKDGIREHVKDLKDSIESAQTLNLLRNDAQQIRSTIELVNANVLDVGSQFRAVSEHEPDPYKKHKAGVSDMEIQVTYAMTTLHEVQSIFDTTYELSADFPVTAEEKMQLSNEEHVLEQLDKKLQGVDKTIGYLADTRAGVTDKNPTSAESAELETVVRTYFDIQLELSTIKSQVAQTSGAVLKSAKAYQQKVNLQYVHCTWASWGLYGLGALVTLLGKLLGDDIEAIE